jgi:hypothetical protein
MDTTSIAPEMVKIDDKSAMRRKCDQPGVVGEKDSCKDSKIRLFCLSKEFRHLSIVEFDFLKKMCLRNRV